jgi:hypothetical protein
MGLDNFSKLTRLPDAYDVRARLTPALLALLPVVAIVIGVHQAEMRLNAAVLSLFGFLGVFYFLATLCREMGKRQEDRLFKKWGGKPSTRLLRHADTFLDGTTKGRYHRFLERWIDSPFPTAGQERSAPEAADELYQAAVRWLLGKTRDKTKYAMLFNENVSYGFRRNCYGIRWIAVCIALLSILWILVARGVLDHSGLHAENLLQLGIGPNVAMLISVVSIPIWLSFFTEETVRTSSISYADFLLRSCDSLPKKR